MRNLYKAIFKLDHNQSIHSGIDILNIGIDDSIVSNLKDKDPKVPLVNREYISYGDETISIREFKETNYHIFGIKHTLITDIQNNRGINIDTQKIILEKKLNNFFCSIEQTREINNLLFAKKIQRPEIIDHLLYNLRGGIDNSKYLKVSDHPIEIDKDDIDKMIYSLSNGVIKNRMPVIFFTKNDKVDMDYIAEHLHGVAHIIYYADSNKTLIPKGNIGGVFWPGEKNYYYIFDEVLNKDKYENSTRIIDRFLEYNNVFPFPETLRWDNLEQRVLQGFNEDELYGFQSKNKKQNPILSSNTGNSNKTNSSDAQTIIIIT